MKKGKVQERKVDRDEIFERELALECLLGYPSDFIRKVSKADIRRGIIELPCQKPCLVWTSGGWRFMASTHGFHEIVQRLGIRAYIEQAQKNAINDFGVGW